MSRTARERLTRAENIKIRTVESVVLVKNRMKVVKKLLEDTLSTLDETDHENTIRTRAERQVKILFDWFSHCETILTTLVTVQRETTAKSQMRSKKELTLKLCNEDADNRLIDALKLGTRTDIEKALKVELAKLTGEELTGERVVTNRCSQAKQPGKKPDGTWVTLAASGGGRRRVWYTPAGCANVVLVVVEEATVVSNIRLSVM